MNSHSRVPPPRRERENKGGGEVGEKRRTGQVCKTLLTEKTNSNDLLKQRQQQITENLREESLLYVKII